MVSDYKELCARLRMACYCCGELQGAGTCQPCLSADAIEAQAREIEELRALVMAWNEVWDNVRIDVQNLREDNKPLAVAATYELLRQDRDALRAKREARAKR